MNRYCYPVIGTLLLLMALSGCGPGNNQPEPFPWPVPEGFPHPVVPADNPMTAAKVELGRYLFYDRRLSANGEQACSDCHHQAHAFAEPQAVSVGSTGEVHHRNSIALVNVAYNASLTWAHNGLVTIERQLLLPLFGEQPVELGITGRETEVLARLDADPYPGLFRRAFGDEEVNFDRVVKALASFVRSLISFDSPFDRYAYQGIDGAMSKAAIRGLNLFMSERLECHHCHGGFNLSQSTTHDRQRLIVEPFHNTGLYNLSSKGAYPAVDTGLQAVTNKASDMGRFRAPGLRNIALSAPYMHDGSIATLGEVVDFYAAGGRHITEGKLRGDGRVNPLKSKFVKGFELSPGERSDLLAFLEALTDETVVGNPAFANPWPGAKE